MNDHAFDDVLKRTRELPREITPSRDLWPSLAQRLSLPPNAVRSRQRLRLPLALVAASLGILLAFLWQPFSPLRSSPDTQWEISTRSGIPHLDTKRIESKGSWRSGQWLETDGGSSARLTIGEIGEVIVDPNSRLRLLDTTPGNHRLKLERGVMHALIWAPPRLFFVETPSATAVDLGCAYTLEVDAAGVGLLEVTAGYVALEHPGRHALVTAGMRCITRPGQGPGTPFNKDTSPAFLEALTHFDLGETASLNSLLSAAQPGDALSLWHLLTRTSRAHRSLIFDKLTVLQPPPSEVTKEGILAGDATLLKTWASSMGIHSSLLP